MKILAIFKSIMILSLIAYTHSQCTGIVVTDADNTNMKNWAVTAVSNLLTSTMTCSQTATCTLTISYPTPDASVLSKVKEYLNFSDKNGVAQAQVFTSNDVAGLRTLSLNFSVSNINNLNPVVSQTSTTVTYSFAVNLILANYCLSMALATINGNIKVSVNSTTGITFNTSSSMLQSNLPGCPPTPGCTVSTTFFLTYGVCTDATCVSILPSKGFKLGETAFVKVILPEALKSIKFKIYLATYSVMSSAGANIYTSEDVSKTMIETQATGYNTESWVIPISSNVVGANGVVTAEIRTITVNMFFVIQTGRNLRYLQQKTEVSQVLRTNLELDPPVVLSGNTTITTINPPSNNNTPINNNTKNNTSSGTFISALTTLFLIFSLLI